MDSKRKYFFYLACLLILSACGSPQEDPIPLLNDQEDSNRVENNVSNDATGNGSAHNDDANGNGASDNDGHNNGTEDNGNNGGEGEDLLVGGLVWQPFEFTCEAPGEYVILEGVGSDLVASAFNMVSPEGDIRLRPSMGMSSFIGDNGDVVIPCGSGNSIAIDWGVRGAVAYADDGFTSGQDLTWETFEFTCPEDETGELLVASGLDPEIVAGTFSRRFENTWSEDVSFGQWMLNSGFGMSTTLTADGDLLVPCGAGNSLGSGDSARIALGREGSSDRLTWDTYEFTCPSGISSEDYFVPESNVDTDFAAVLFTPRHWEDSSWLLNSGGGMSTHLTTRGELRIPCDGFGNSFGPGRVVRLALGYD